MIRLQSTASFRRPSSASFFASVPRPAFAASARRAPPCGSPAPPPACFAWFAARPPARRAWLLMRRGRTRVAAFAVSWSRAVCSPFRGLLGSGCRPLLRVMWVLWASDERRARASKKGRRGFQVCQPLWWQCRLSTATSSSHTTPCTEDVSASPPPKPLPTHPSYLHAHAQKKLRFVIRHRTSYRARTFIFTACALSYSLFAATDNDDLYEGFNVSEPKGPPQGPPMTGMRPPAPRPCARGGLASRAGGTAMGTAMGAGGQENRPMTAVRAAGFTSKPPATGCASSTR